MDYGENRHVLGTSHLFSGWGAGYIFYRGGGWWKFLLVNWEGGGGVEINNPWSGGVIYFFYAYWRVGAVFIKKECLSPPPPPSLTHTFSVSILSTLKNVSFYFVTRAESSAYSYIFQWLLGPFCEHFYW